MKHLLICGQTRAIVDDVGAELISFYKDIEYLWQGDPAYWEGHSPVLFPNPSVLMNDTICIAGKEYHLEKHGFVRGKQFTVVAQSPSAITLLYKANAETLVQYPFDFALYVRHEIDENGFVTCYRVENNDSKTMYFCIGGHPSFNCPMREGESFEDYDLRFSEMENARAYYTNQGKYMDRDLFWHRLNNTDTWQLKHSDFDRDSSIFEGLKSDYVSLIHRHTGEGIRMHIGNFPALVIWKAEKSNAPFLCIEPWQGIPAVKGESGNFEDKPYAVKLLPGETYQSSFAMEICQRGKNTVE